MSLTASQLTPETALFRHVIPAGEPYLFEVKAGQTLPARPGRQPGRGYAVLQRRQPARALRPQRTLRRQDKIYLTTGSVLYSNLGNPLLTIVADTCGRHDTLGGACAQESNTVRYALGKRHMHSCRDNFLRACLHDGRLDKRDIGANINFFMNVPVTPEGGLTFEDGLSGPGKYVELKAAMDVIVLISNCPQLNNPCNGWNPTPAEVLVWD